MVTSPGPSPRPSKECWVVQNNSCLPTPSASVRCQGQTPPCQRRSREGAEDAPRPVAAKTRRGVSWKVFLTDSCDDLPLPTALFMVG